MKTNNKGTTLVGLMTIIIIVLILLAFILPPIVGVAPFGPERTVTATVTRLYVDTSKESSHYMVVTNEGVFEVNNSLWLWMWNADEVYGGLKDGKTYNITIKGNKVVNFWFQKYPYVTHVTDAIKLDLP